MTPIILVGYSGKMSKALQSLMAEKKTPFKIFSAQAPSELRIETFNGSAGVIDFSLPDATEGILAKVCAAGVPYVCGTTGFANKEGIIKSLAQASASIPIVFDSNFSLGVEILCAASELLAAAIKTPIEIVDIHHIHKRDKPSGTALKIRDRILSANQTAPIQIKSERIGEVFGEHKVIAQFADESIEFIHRAHSRLPFAAGALKALEWARNQKPGLYSVKDVLK